MEANTIILWHDSCCLSERDYRQIPFEKGDTIWGENSFPIELKRWDIEEKEEAEKELAKHMCHYRGYYEYNDYQHNYPNGFSAIEYALEYCTCDEDGDIVYSSGECILAEEEATVEAREIVKSLQEGTQHKSYFLWMLCYLAELSEDWKNACEYEEALANGDAEEGDNESCEEVLLQAAERLGVEIPLN